MLRIFLTSSGVSGASVSRLLVIEIARDLQHPRDARTIRRNHVLFAPLGFMRPGCAVGQSRAEGTG